MGLTKNEKDDLNKAVLEYLYKNNYKVAYDAFAQEAEVDQEDLSKMRNILESKWKAVARLKKQII